MNTAFWLTVAGLAIMVLGAALVHPGAGIFMTGVVTLVMGQVMKD